LPYHETSPKSKGAISNENGRPDTFAKMGVWHHRFFHGAIGDSKCGTWHVKPKAGGLGISLTSGVKQTRHNAPRRALRLACDVLIARQRCRKGVRRPSSNAAREIPFDTAFDTASRFWVLNGIKWQHGARTCQRRLCDGIRRNHDTSRKRKYVAKLRVNCSTN
jgi:hypothetical protein